MVWTYTDNATVLAEASAHVWLPVFEATAEGLDLLAANFASGKNDPIRVVYRPTLYPTRAEGEMPKPPFQFDKEDMTGTNPKIKIIDANGVKWNMKFDEEVHAEIACSRIVWACGFMVFVIAIFVSLFVSFNVFAINMVLQYRRVGAWRDYLHGERAYRLRIHRIDLRRGVHAYVQQLALQQAQQAEILDDDRIDASGPRFIDHL